MLALIRAARDADRQVGGVLDAARARRPAAAGRSRAGSARAGAGARPARRLDARFLRGDLLGAPRACSASISPGSAFSLRVDLGELRRGRRGSCSAAVDEILADLRDCDRRGTRRAACAGSRRARRPGSRSSRVVPTQPDGLPCSPPLRSPAPRLAAGLGGGVAGARALASARGAAQPADRGQATAAASGQRAARTQRRERLGACA